MADHSVGEMYDHPGDSDSWYNLPRGDGIAYAAQEAWVLNETIRVSHRSDLWMTAGKASVGKHPFRLDIRRRALSKR
jgi:hypothetical protein